MAFIEAPFMDVAVLFSETAKEKGFWQMRLRYKQASLSLMANTGLPETDGITGI